MPLVEKWKGIHKLTEECGEVLQLLGKLGVFPDGNHPDGKGPLKQRIADELADLEAAIAYFKMVNKLGGPAFNERRKRKYDLFIKWKLSGVPCVQETRVTPAAAHSKSDQVKVR